MPRKKDTISQTRSLLYGLGKALGDVNAMRKGKVGRRIGRRAAGKAAGRALRGLFR
ncbi:MAG: hypothetical protein AB1330_10825 [Bacillota bacterium]